MNLRFSKTTLEASEYIKLLRVSGSRKKGRTWRVFVGAGSRETVMQMSSTTWGWDGWSVPFNELGSWLTSFEVSVTSNTPFTCHVLIHPRQSFAPSDLGSGNSVMIRFH